MAQCFTLKGVRVILQLIAKWSRFLLSPFAIIYGVMQLFRRLCYKVGFRTPTRFPGYTISVGNLEAGGTGKSPVVIALAQKLREENFNPVIVTRGYKSGLKARETLVLLNGKIIQGDPPAKFLADEAKMQSAALPTTPIIIGTKRSLGIERYLKNFPAASHWILDDGFQHLQIHRDYDLVLLDYQSPFSNGWPLPCGHLREFPMTLSRASGVLLTRAQSEALPTALKPYENMPIFFASFRSDQLTHRCGPHVALKEAKICLVAGIAKPQQLVQALGNMGLIPIKTYWVADHQPFSPEQLLLQAKGCQILVTTEKDYHRDPQIFEFLGMGVYVLSLRANIDTFYDSKEFHKFRNI